MPLLSLIDSIYQLCWEILQSSENPFEDYRINYKNAIHYDRNKLTQATPSHSHPMTHTLVICKKVTATHIAFMYLVTRARTII